MHWLQQGHFLQIASTFHNTFDINHASTVLKTTESTPSGSYKTKVSTLPAEGVTKNFFDIGNDMCFQSTDECLFVRI